MNEWTRNTRTEFPEWTIGQTPAGDVLLSLVHSESAGAYLKGKGQQTHLHLNPEQARNLADELREVAARLATETPASERAQDQPPNAKLNPLLSRLFYGRRTTDTVDGGGFLALLPYDRGQRLDPIACRASQGASSRGEKS